MQISYYCMSRLEIGIFINYCFNILLKLAVSLTDSSRGLSQKIREIFAKNLQNICEIFAKYSRKIREKFAKNLRKICEKFAKYSQKIREKFAKNSQKINIPEFFRIFSRIFRKYFANFNFLRIFCEFFANFSQIFRDRPREESV